MVPSAPEGRIVMSMSKSGLFTVEGAPIPLRGVEVEGEVLGAHARVRVRQRYVCVEARPIEAVYTFPLPSSATLVGFAMTCGGRRLDGVVKEREQAFRDYDDAVTSGHGAALLEQERPNVFTASVGNLLPNEETLVEIEYLERLRADEGALRWMIPTLVAPRYIPGGASPAMARTAHGTADPTDRVPDADRITPPLAHHVDYGLKLDLTLDLGAALEVESPSHAIAATREGTRTRVRFAAADVALDRDVVIVARRADAGPLETVALHRPADGPGYVALTVVPDFSSERATPRQDVVFVVDVSGSMDGASIVEARAALKLCLRHLREGDRFNVIAFQSTSWSFQPRLVPFTQRTLELADAWVDGLVADGGTEMLQPLLDAAGLAPDGVIVLLTDGQVGNEDELARAVLAARKSARLYPFGIGTNVSDALLGELAKRSGGALEMIHPGERIDEKVVAQFARAIAPRVSGVSVRFSGVEIGDVAPAEPPALVDGEPWVVYGRLEGGAHGEAEIRGTLDGKPFRMVVPIHAGESTSQPAIGRLWAAERIRDLLHTERSGRAAARMRERIVELATTWSVSSPYTAFLVVETRTGDRRATGMPETRVVPVNVPAGWAMFDRKQAPQAQKTAAAMPARPKAPQPTMAAPRGRVGAGVLGEIAGAAARLFKKGAAPSKDEASCDEESFESHGPGAAHAHGGGGADDDQSRGADIVLEASDQGESPVPEAEALLEPMACMAPPRDPIVELLQQQLASGLWDDRSAPTPAIVNDPRYLRATALALLELYRAGVTTSHALHGAQVKKAVAALLALAKLVGTRDAAAELALGVAWLVASGPRTRRDIERAITGAALDGLRSRLADEAALRDHVTALAAK
jgi:Ca-activated chloride channel homolog